MASTGRVDRRPRHLSGHVPDGLESGHAISIRSPQWVIGHMMNAVFEPWWSPAASARHQLTHAVEEPVLRAARLWLQMATAERTTLAQARALATVNVALALVDERLRPELRGRGDAVPGEVP